jgi:rSAM/selenodomain-associated transferase 1
MEIPYQDAMILLFIKYPEPGRVKTRLASAIGKENATEFYRNSILDTLLKLESTGCPLRICFLPENKEEALISWLGDGYQYSPQKGEDLGERMKVAFMDAFSEGYDRVILPGSDLPDIPSSFFKESLDALNTHDVVIGPAWDGGYYLVGFKRHSFCPDIFEGMEWSTDGVFQETLARLNKQRKKTYILPVWHDVDTYEDLVRLMRGLESADSTNSKTMTFLSKLKAGD